jgi:alanyl-tRNA synthetase
MTARGAVAAAQRTQQLLGEAAGKLRCAPDELPARVEALQEEIKKLQKQLQKGATADLGGTADKLFASAVEKNGAKIIVGEIPSSPEEAVRAQVDRLRQKAESAVIVFAWNDEEAQKVGLLAAVTDDLVKKGLHAGKLVGAVAKVMGGGGGGKPTMASAGGKDASKLAEALELARKLATDGLGG